jgi:hypothetical protein
LVTLIHSLPTKCAVAARTLFTYAKECLEEDTITLDDFALITKKLIDIEQYENTPLL